jgi:hypothetical protein
MLRNKKSGGTQDTKTIAKSDQVEEEFKISYGFFKNP